MTSILAVVYPWVFPISVVKAVDKDSFLVLAETDWLAESAMIAQIDAQMANNKLSWVAPNRTSDNISRMIVNSIPSASLEVYVTKAANIIKCTTYSFKRIILAPLLLELLAEVELNKAIKPASTNLSNIITFEIWSLYLETTTINFAHILYTLF